MHHQRGKSFISTYRPKEPKLSEFQISDTAQTHGRSNSAQILKHHKNTKSIIVPQERDISFERR